MTVSVLIMSVLFALYDILNKKWCKCLAAI